MSYFDKHCAQINAACEHDNRAVIGAGVLTLLSIRQPFYLMPRQIESVALMGAESQYLFGFKRDGFRYIRENASHIRQRANAARGKTDAESLNTLIIELMAVPGFQIVKASFFAQMLIGRGACLDSHNLERLGLAGDAFKTPKSLLPRTIAAKVATYNGIWQAHGSSAYWWDSWCDHIAGVYPKHFANGEAVSAMHGLALQMKGGA